MTSNQGYAFYLLRWGGNLRVVVDLTADMVDLANSTNRLAHKSEENSAVMNSLAELMRGNTAALMNLAAQVPAQHGGRGEARNRSAGETNAAGGRL